MENTALEKLSTVFKEDDKKSASSVKKQYEQEVSELYPKGRLITQVEWLKEGGFEVD